MTSFVIRSPPIEINQESQPVGYGTYGYVYHPSYLLGDFSPYFFGETNKPPFCNSNNYVINEENAKQFATKIGSSKSMIIEYMEYDKMKRIQSNQFYYPKPLILTNGILNLPIPNVVTEKFQFNETNASSFLVMNYGGADLYKTGLHVGNELQLEYNMNIFRGFNQLFEGIKSLLSIGLVHYDLKPQNIVFNVETSRLMMIDFGSMGGIDLPHYRKIETSVWWNWPMEHFLLNPTIYRRFLNIETTSIEYSCEIITDIFFNNRFQPNNNNIIQLLTYLFNITENPSEKETKLRGVIEGKMYRGYAIDDRVHIFLYLVTMWEQNFIRNSLIFDDNHTLTSFNSVLDSTYENSKKILADFKDNFLNFLQQIHAKKLSHEEFIKTMSATFDVYGLGLSLSYIVSSTKKDEQHKDSLVKLKNIALSCLNPNMFERCNANKAVESLRSILPITGGKYTTNNENIFAFGNVPSKSHLILKLPQQTTFTFKDKIVPLYKPTDSTHSTEITQEETDAYYQNYILPERETIFSDFLEKNPDSKANYKELTKKIAGGHKSKSKTKKYRVKLKNKTKKRSSKSLRRNKRIHRSTISILCL